MGSLLVASVIAFTVAGSVSLGIVLAYTSVLALLHALARSNQPAEPVVMARAQSAAAGD